MSVRAIAVRDGPRAVLIGSSGKRLARSFRRVAPARVRRRPVQPPASFASFWTSFSDDRRLVGVKLILMGLLFLAVMALEVPW